MKKRLIIFLCILLTGLLYASPAFAEEELWNSTINPICDPDKNFSDEDLQKIGRYYMDIIPELEFDCTIFLITEDRYDQYGFDHYLTGIYEQNNRGYGINKDGIIVGIDYKNETFMIRTFGRGNQIFDIDLTKTASEEIRKGYQENGLEGIVTGFYSFIYDTISASDIKYSKELQDYGEGYHMAAANLNQKRPIHQIYDTNLPDWYLQGEDVDHYEYFHNDITEPRIIDNADILSDDEETRLNTAIEQIRDTYAQDVVVYTDTTSYGVDNELYSQDFYVFNGYGLGDEHDGLILFVNMDPDNREIVTSAKGSARDHYTAELSSSLDDILYDAFVEKRYGDGILNWIEAVEEYFHYGNINFPEWYKLDLDHALPEDYHETKMIDDLNWLTAEERTAIEEKLESLTNLYNTDCIIYLAKEAIAFDENVTDDDARIKQYADQFFETCGYGVGNSKNAIMMLIFNDGSSSYRLRVYAYGDPQNTINEKTLKRLGDYALMNLSDGEYANHINKYIDKLEVLLRTGRVPHAWYVLVFWFILCLITGCITMAIAFNRAKRKMHVVQESSEAYADMVENSLVIHRSTDVFLGLHETRHYSPQSTSDSDSSSSSSRSGSSSRSTYSSSSRSSSGETFSSSRRKF